ncbi:MAG: hypothetical protein V2B18_05490 [Pseudomonadota bacterium]
MAMDLDSQYEHDYQAWKRGLYGTYCMGTRPDFNGEPCPLLVKASRRCRMPEPRPDEKEPRRLGRCVKEVVYTVSSFLQVKYRSARTQEYDDMEVISSFTKAAKAGLGGNREENEQPLPQAFNIVTMVSWIETAVKRSLFGSYSRRICGNCEHYMDDSRACGVDPCRSTKKTTMVPRRICRNCEHFRANPSRCSDNRRSGIRSTSPMCPEASTKLLIPICDNCSYFRKADVKCSMNASLDVTHLSPMCGKARPQPVVLCDDFTYRTSEERPAVADLPPVSCAPGKKAELKHLLTTLELWRNERGISRAERARRARCMALVEAMLDCKGEIPPDDHPFWERHEVTKQTARNDLARIRRFLASGPSTAAVAGNRTLFEERGRTTARGGAAGLSPERISMDNPRPGKRNCTI